MRNKEIIRTLLIQKKFNLVVYRLVVLGLREIMIDFQLGYPFGYLFGSLLEISSLELIPT
jgi:hypothetical protein